MLAQDIRIGIRSAGGSDRGQLGWRLPTRETITKILQHPIYAGYYCYGRTKIDPRRRKPGKRWSGRIAVPREEYLAMIPDKYPAYISREQYEVNQRRLAENRARTESKGAPRDGPSLLAGLITCARCGKRMAVHYSGRAQTLRYTCVTGVANGRGTCRHALAGRVIDQLVVEQVLAALQPGALDLSLSAAEDVIRERTALDKNWRQRVERSQIDAARIERQYQAAEPENRLVARTLEQRWEEALQDVRRLEEEYARFRQAQPAALTGREADQIRRLACDLPALWTAGTTTAADRQQIIRFLVEGVKVEIEGVSDRVHAIVSWVGGQQTHHDIIRPVRRYEQTANFDRLIARVWELRAQGLSCRMIGDQLNTDGYRPPKGASRFCKTIVVRLLKRQAKGTPPGANRSEVKLEKDEWFVRDLAQRLKIGKNTLHAWLQRGWVAYRRVLGYCGRCVCWADKEELRRLRRLVQTPRDWWNADVPSELITPKPRPTK